jgi:hypothetical protein
MMDETAKRVLDNETARRSRDKYPKPPRQRAAVAPRRKRSHVHDPWNKPDADMRLFFCDSVRRFLAKPIRLKRSALLSRSTIANSQSQGTLSR